MKIKIIIIYHKKYDDNYILAMLLKHNKLAY